MPRHSDLLSQREPYFFFCVCVFLSAQVHVCAIVTQKTSTSKAYKQCYPGTSSAIKANGWFYPWRLEYDLQGCSSGALDFLCVILLAPSTLRPEFSNRSTYNSWPSESMLTDIGQFSFYFKFNNTLCFL